MLSLSLYIRKRSDAFPIGLDDRFFKREPDPDPRNHGKEIVIGDFIAFRTPRSQYSHWVIQQDLSKAQMESLPEDERENRPSHGNITAFNEEPFDARIRLSIVLSDLNQKRFKEGSSDKIPAGCTVPRRYASLVLFRPRGAADYDYEIRESLTSAERARGMSARLIGTASIVRQRSDADAQPADNDEPAPAASAYSTAPASRYQTQKAAAVAHGPVDEDDIPF